MKHRAEITRHVIIISHHFHWRHTHCDESNSENLFFTWMPKITENKETSTCINFRRESVIYNQIFKYGYDSFVYGSAKGIVTNP